MTSKIFLDNFPRPYYGLGRGKLRALIKELGPKYAPKTWEADEEFLSWLQSVIETYMTRDTLADDNDFLRGILPGVQQNSAAMHALKHLLRIPHPQLSLADLAYRASRIANLFRGVSLNTPQDFFDHASKLYRDARELSGGPNNIVEP